MVQDIFFSCILIAVLGLFHRQIREALENINRRGGPPTARHPSPALDDEILRRRNPL